MKRPIQLSIPEPCHEDWNNMTVVQQGRFCNMCQKQVVDFSVMTDNEILAYISTAGSRICARAGNDQLNRNLLSPEAPRKTWWKYWMSVAASFIMLSAKTNAQTGKLKALVSFTPVYKKPVPTAVVVGTVANVENNNRKIELRGQVVNENNIPVPYATVKLTDSHDAVSADSSGNFILHTYADPSDISLVVSSVGYSSKTIAIDKKENIKKLTTGNNSMQLELQSIILTAQTMKEIVFTGNQLYRTRLGAMVRSISITRVQKVKTACKDAFGTNEVKIYPNPVSANTLFNISFNCKDYGEYNVQFVDVSGKIIAGKQINIPTKNYVESFNGNMFIAHGIYFIHVTCKQNGKSYAAKLLVQ